MSGSSTPTGPPPGPRWSQVQEPAKPSRPGGRRSALTHSAAALVGLVVGVLIGIVGSGQPKNTPPPVTAVTVTETAPGSAEPPTQRGDPTPAARDEIPGDGTFLVGKEIKPGTYRSAGAADDTVPQCYWARLKGTSGALTDVLANGIVEGQATVTILATDNAFQSTGCQTWKKIG